MADTEFTAEDLRMIKAMCTSANPQYPERDMYPAWQHVYEVASNQLKIMTAPIRCEAWCSQHPNCQHDWSSWKPVKAHRQAPSHSAGGSGHRTSERP